MSPTTVNKRYSEYDVYIGRGSKWGNPFPIDIKTGNTREVVIDKYRDYIYDKIMNGELTRKDFMELKGMRLGCYCSPKPCHGDILIEIYNLLVDDESPIQWD